MKININGIDKEVSKETIGLAVTAYFADHPEQKPEPKYQFQAGDVVRNPNVIDGIRIVVRPSGGLKSFSLDGYYKNTGQTDFELNDYKKIGTLKDFISKDILQDLARNRVDLEEWNAGSFATGMKIVGQMIATALRQKTK